MPNSMIKPEIIIKLIKSFNKKIRSKKKYDQTLGNIPIIIRDNNSIPIHKLDNNSNDIK